MQPPIRLLLIPLLPIVMLLAPFLTRPHKHAPPLREMHQRHRRRAHHDHDPHQPQPRRRRVFRAREEKQLSQSRSEVAAGASEAGDDAEGPPGNEGDDAESGAARGLRSDGEENHGGDGKWQRVGSPQANAEDAAEGLEDPEVPKAAPHAEPPRRHVRH